ncbi:protein translocase subunit SecD [Treponema socranskii]|uniref:protein translocase subunit SecD n=1 Tax=Treponema socranskii TaxID=53419 RepID=UPI0028EEE22C|nr:protein translocase subunit SecD [Treponema socranskii]
MNKRTRFVILLAVLAVCFAFLWPSISWYYGTPKEMKALALGSLQSIKDYATVKASDDVKAFTDAARKDPNAPLDKSYGWIKKIVVRNYKNMDVKESSPKSTVLNWIKKIVSRTYRNRESKVPSPLTKSAVLNAFSSEQEFREAVQARYRDTILKAKKQYQNSVKLGLDLSGGMNIIVKADLDAAVKNQEGADTAESSATLKANAMQQAIDSLSSRIDRFGLTSPVIRQQGEDRIYIEIPGAAEADAINTIIMGKGILNFRLVDDAATQAFNNYYLQNPGNVFASDGTLLDASVIPADCEVLGLYQNDDYGLEDRIGWLAVKKEIALDGRHIKSAEVGSSNLTNRPEVDFVLDGEGAVIFGEFTSAHVGERLAIVNDNRIRSAATIENAITGGRVAITGFNLEEAQTLQKVLQTAWLSVPLSVESQQVIGASLGQKAKRMGIIAVLVGLGAIMFFMLVYYKGAGVNACVAQILNLYIVFSVLSAFNMTITLSSIAGMILTIGMAVDANVIIFERIKEELSDGKGRTAAIAAGFRNAFWAIMDSNITTFIAAMFLSQLGSGAIQGFAVSLAIGVVSSVFTALFVSHLMFDFNTDVFRKDTVSISWRVK